MPLLRLTSIIPNNGWKKQVKQKTESGQRLYFWVFTVNGKIFLITIKSGDSVNTIMKLILARSHKRASSRILCWTCSRLSNSGKDFKFWYHYRDVIIKQPFHSKETGDEPRRLWRFASYQQLQTCLISVLRRFPRSYDTYAQFNLNIDNQIWRKG